LVLNACNRATEKKQQRYFREILCLGREVRVKTKDDLLLPNGRKRVIASNIAALNGNKEVLDKLYVWGKEVQVNLKGELLPAKD